MQKEKKKEEEEEEQKKKKNEPLDVHARYLPPLPEKIHLLRWRVSVGIKGNNNAQHSSSSCDEYWGEHLATDMQRNNNNHMHNDTTIYVGKPPKCEE